MRTLDPLTEVDEALARKWRAIGKVKCITSRCMQAQGALGVPVKATGKGELEIRHHAGCVSYRWRGTDQVSLREFQDRRLAMESLELFDGRYLYEESGMLGTVSVSKSDVKHSANAAMNLQFPPILVSWPCSRLANVTFDSDAEVGGQIAFVIRRTLRNWRLENPEGMPPSVLATAELRYFSKANGVLLRREYLDADGTVAGAVDFDAFEISPLCDEPPFAYEPRDGVEVVVVGDCNE